MKTLILLLIAAAIVLGLAAANHSDPKPAVDAFRPGSEHALLQRLAGTWDAVLIGPGPDGREARTNGKLVTTVLSSFHTTDSYEGEMMGLTFIGHAINGYCTVRKQYFTYWADSMTSSPLTAYGDYDAVKRELVLKGECLGMSGKLEPCKIVTRLVDDDHRTFTMFGPGPDGKETKHLTIEYTRKR